MRKILGKKAQCDLAGDIPCRGCTGSLAGVLPRRGWWACWCGPCAHATHVCECAVRHRETGKWCTCWAEGDRVLGMTGTVDAPELHTQEPRGRTFRGLRAGKEWRVPQAGPAPQSSRCAAPSWGAGLRLQPYLLGGQQQLHSLLVLTMLQEEVGATGQEGGVRLFVQVLCHQL